MSIIMITDIAGSLYHQASKRIVSNVARRREKPNGFAVALAAIQQ
jgi:hypothetical protein